MAEHEVRDPVWAREVGRRRSTLTRDAIVRAAMVIADNEGIDAVSIRRVATELGARAMSIYTYIDRKEDLLDLMADEVAGDVLVPGELPADWREATLAIARRERSAVHRHPWIIELVSRRSATGSIGPNSLRHLEQTLAALATLDASAEWRLRLVTAIGDYTTGFVVREASLRATVADPDTAAQLATVLDQPYLRRQLAGEDFPHLSALVASDPPAIEDNNFTQGLHWIMAGFEAQLRPL